MDWSLFCHEPDLKIEQTTTTAGSGQVQIHPDLQARFLVVVVVTGGVVMVEVAVVVDEVVVAVSYGGALIETKLLMLTAQQTNKSRDAWLGQGIVTLFKKPAD